MKFKALIKQNSSLILTGAGLAGLALTTGLAIYETWKLSEELDPSMSKKEIRKKIFKRYTPVAVSAITTSALNISAAITAKNTEAKLLAAAIASGESYVRLNEAVYNNADESTINAIKSEELESANEAHAPMPMVQFTEDSDPIPDWDKTHKFFLPYVSTADGGDFEFETTFGNVMNAMYLLNRQVCDYQTSKAIWGKTGPGYETMLGTASLANFIDYLQVPNLEPTAESCNYGWHIDPDREIMMGTDNIAYWIDIGFHKYTDENGEYYSIDFSFPPVSDYYEF